MLKEVTLPGISENVDSGEVIGILVSVGDVVEKDQPVVELETEKAAFEVPAPDKGRITEILIKQGQTVNVGEVLAKLETDLEAAPEAEAKEEPPAKEEKAVSEAPEEPSDQEEEEVAEKPQRERPQPQKAAPARQPERKEKKAEPSVPVAAAPSVRQLARELGIDINDVSGSGPDGRISSEDVKEHARSLIGGKPAPARPAAPAPTAAPAREEVRPLPDLAQYGPVERQPMSKTRRTIAETMAYGWRHVPHVTQYDRADITDLEAFRQAHAGQIEKAGGKLSVTSIITKIVASALQKFPQFNASLDEQANELVYRQYYHIAVAVDTDRGLLVPVVRDVDSKSLRDVSVEIVELAKKARNKQITPDELMGGCFTVSNLGGLGGTYFAPIVYWPQVAILGISRSVWEVVPRDGDIEERLILPLSLSYDHRVIDGADGARFLHWIVQALEQPLLAIL